MLTERPRLAPRSNGRLPGRVVCLLDVDNTIADAVAGTALASEPHRLNVPALELPAGPWVPPPELRKAIAMLVVDGILTRDGDSGGRPHLQLVGPGDLLDPRAVTPKGATWQVLERATIAVLDARIVLAARSCPQLMVGLTRRLFDCQAEHLSLLAMMALPRVEDRVLALLGHFADRWGTATPEGRVLHLPVTHALLGRFIGAQRPTVSLALTKLADERRLVREHGGRWTLPPQPAPDAARTLDGGGHAA